MRKPEHHEDRTARGAALQYEGTTPRVIAAARGQLVTRLLELAHQHHIPIHRDADLAGLLSALQPGSLIPEELYRPVAIVLTRCYRINKEFRDKLTKLNRHEKDFS